MLAQTLQATPIARLDEASKRTVVSRAYYAAYHIAIAYASNSKNPPQLHFDADDHGKLVAYFRDYSKVPNIASLLTDLRKWRNRCDYEDDINNLDLLTQNSIQKTQAVINLLAPAP